MKYDLAGASYDDEADDGAGNEGDITGASTQATDNCTTATDRSVYLCGYELTTDIDAGASCPNYDGTNGDDLTPDDSDDDNADDCGSGQSAWVPVGQNTTAADRFTGAFDGNGHRISNLYYKGIRDYSGFLGYINGTTIRNVGLSNVYINVENQASIGGLVGAANNSSINNSYVTGSISGSNFTGGLLGTLSNNSSINNSYMTGSVMGADRTGGLAGELIHSSRISNSYAAANVSATIYVGGLIGFLGSSSVVANSYATGSVTGNSNTNSGNYGGLVGVMNTTSISNSYATGSLHGPATNQGGLIGWLPSGTITGRNYYVAAEGTNGIGSGTCADTVCIQAGAGVTPAITDDAGRYAWLQATLDESAATDATPPGLGWDSDIWGDFTTAGKYPCLKNMPKGAPVCE